MESDIADINTILSREYLLWASYDRMINLYKFYIKKYSNLTENYYSFEMAKLYKQVSYLIVNTGDVSKFGDAQNYLEKAIDIIENIFQTSKDFAALYSEIYYLYSIVFEHRGDMDKAYRVCIDAIKDITKKKLAFLAPDTLQRQVYLLTKDTDLIVNINETSVTTDLFELFQNKRRLFQLYLQNHDIKNADNTKNEIETIIKLGGARLDKIYIGMYYRDMTRYYWLKKEWNMSKIYFRKAINIFTKFNFEGQKRMLFLDNEQYRYKTTDMVERSEIYE